MSPHPSKLEELEKEIYLLKDKLQVLEKRIDSSTSLPLIHGLSEIHREISIQNAESKESSHGGINEDMQLALPNLGK